MSKNTFAKFRRVIDKYTDDTFAVGFSKSELWSSTGNYALNYLLSGDFFKGYMFGRSVVISGVSGSGKSVVMATGCAMAQKTLGARILWIDSENASDRKEFFTKCGMNVDDFEDIAKAPKGKKKKTDEEDPVYGGENFIYMQVGKISRTKQIIADIIKIINAEIKDLDDPLDPAAYRPIVIAIDSYSNLMTDTESENMESGKAVGDHPRRFRGMFLLVTSPTFGRLSSRTSSTPSISPVSPATARP